MSPRPLDVHDTVMYYGIMSDDDSAPASLDSTQLPAEHDTSTMPGTPIPTRLHDVISGELLPLALEVYRDLMVNGKNEKIRLEAANAVTELEGARGSKGPSNIGFTFNVPPEYLSKSLKALGSLKITHEEVIDVQKDP